MVYTSYHQTLGGLQLRMSSNEIGFGNTTIHNGLIERFNRILKRGYQNHLIIGGASPLYIHMLFDHNIMMPNYVQMRGICYTSQYANTKLLAGYNKEWQALSNRLKHV